ncbi:MAG: PilZ domain-containing protein [Deltaproteobacteria bacterium]|nr:PilZ domain-containing protein [Deltaproteobacteria bacterium]
MGLAEWIESLRGLHERAKQGKLDGSDLAGYQRAREELASALIAAQRLQLKEGETARQALRVARALQLDLEIDGNRQRAMTLDLSMTGFSTMLGKGPEGNAPIPVTLRLPGGVDPLDCKAKMQGIKRQGGSWRVSFTFDKLSESDTERLGMVVFDTALEQLKR